MNSQLYSGRMAPLKFFSQLRSLKLGFMPICPYVHIRIFMSLFSQPWEQHSEQKVSVLKEKEWKYSEFYPSVTVCSGHYWYKWHSWQIMNLRTPLKRRQARDILDIIDEMAAANRSKVSPPEMAEILGIAWFWYFNHKKWNLFRKKWMESSKRGYICCIPTLF